MGTFVLAFAMTCMGSPIQKDLAKKPANLTLMYETLGHSCQFFIVNTLYPVFKAFKSHMHLELRPYGLTTKKFNPQSKMWKFTCPHGEQECWANTLQTCAIIHSDNNAESYMDFIVCYEKNCLKDKTKACAENCANEHSQNFNELDECATGKEGNNYQNDMSLITNIQPASGEPFVPYIYFNNDDSADTQNAAQQELKKLVCSVIPFPKPQGCS